MKDVILCVDDEKMVLMSIMEQLWECFGSKYMYEMAMSGEEALEIIDVLAQADTKVVLIISDWLMGGMKGDELVKYIREKYPKVRTIILSGQADPASIEDVKKNGALNAFVAKPWDRDSLMKTIQEQIKGIQA